MDTKKMRKLSQLYVDETLHKDIKVIVSNLFNAEFKTDKFFNFCKQMHIAYIDEKRAFGEDPVGFDAYCEANLDYLKDEFHKSL